MDLAFSDDQRSIIDSVVDMLTDVMPIAKVREVLGGDAAPLGALWSKAAEFGWFGLGLDEDLGGTGFGLVDEALLFKEIGRHITPGPFLATALAARVAARGGAGEVAAALLGGQARAGLAVPLSGNAVGLVGAAGADYVLVVHDTVAGLFPASAATERTTVDGLDGLTSREQAVLDGDPLSVVSADDDPIAQRGSVLVSAMFDGIAEAARDMAVGYAKTREQFGSPIGAFQAVKHRCADMAVAAALADAQLVIAALSVGDLLPDAPLQVASARVVAERAALDNIRETIQIHAGIGVTWECDAHLYLKRVHALRELFGDLTTQRQSLLG
ncbi:MAG: acyl-CoA dehydrogenase family protein [Mycobacteriales bacterium]